MNRENYDPKVLSTFDIISSFFVDVFYNSLYLKARDRVREGKHQSLTDAYKTNIINYLYGIKQQQLYMQVVLSLHEYYQKVTVYSTIIFSDFENKLLCQFIPPEYYRDFTEKDKDANLCAIITHAVQEFGEIVLSSEYLRMIIDDHRNQLNITRLQDSIVEILIKKREEYYVQFAKKINQRSDKVSSEVLKKLKDELMKETRKRCTAEQKQEKAVGIIKQLVQKIAAMEGEIDKLKQAQENQHRLNIEMAQSRAPVNTLKDEPVRALTSGTPSDELDDAAIYKQQREMLAKRIAERQARNRTTFEPAKQEQEQVKHVQELAKQEPQPSASPGGLLSLLDDDPGFGI